MKMKEEEESLQEKLEKIKFILPQSGQTHIWKKSSYIKNLAIKVQNSFHLMSQEWSDFSPTSIS